MGDLDRDLETTPVRYGPRRPVPRKLDAYKAIIETRLAAYPALSAVRLLAEMRAAGYGGSDTQLTAWVRQIRPTPPSEPVIRFETPAGRQAQVDFARFSFAWGVRYAQAIDVTTYDRQRDRLREELTLAQIDRHATELEKIDVEGILAFAERVLPSAPNLCVQASLDQKQRLQQLFFPDGLRFDGKRLVRTGLTLPIFNYLESAEGQGFGGPEQRELEPIDQLVAAD